MAIYKVHKFIHSLLIGLVSSVILFILPFYVYALEANTDKQATTVSNQPSVPIHLQINGTLIDMSSILMESKNGSTMISLENLPSLLNCTTKWQPPYEIIINTTADQIIMCPGQLSYTVNGIPAQLSASPYLSGVGDVLVPLRSVAEGLGYRVDYKASTKTVAINSADYLSLVKSDPKEQNLPEPNQEINFKILPTWGSLEEYPELKSLWKDENLVVGYYTRLINSPATRTDNIRLSCSQINGKILKPGETFSFNQTVGPRTIKTGYKIAKVFSGNKIVDGIGGGICQTSSTIYNVALEAGMKIVERYPHTIKVAYVAPKRDATVSWGGADFRFRNSKDYSIKILCKVEEGLVCVAFARVQAVPPASSSETAAP